jgi:hypothetical protein
MVLHQWVPLIARISPIDFGKRTFPNLSETHCYNRSKMRDEINDSASGRPYRNICHLIPLFVSPSSSVKENKIGKVLYVTRFISPGVENGDLMIGKIIE